MPHFIIECSENVLELKPADQIIEAVYHVAVASELFADNDVKVRLTSFKYYKLGEDKNDFLHIFGYIMEGRTIGQRAQLSKTIIQCINEMLPDLSFLSINISEFQKATYCNKAIIHPLNTIADRHFPG